MPLYRMLAADHPAVADFCSEPGMSHNNLGSLLSRTAKLDAAEAGYRMARAIERKLVDDSPAVTEFGNRLVRTRLSLGWLLYQLVDSSEAEAEYRKALVIERKLVEDNPAVTTSDPCSHPATSTSLRCYRRPAGRPRQRPRTVRRSHCGVSWPPRAAR
jgi:hypothetical protein